MSILLINFKYRQLLQFVQMLLEHQRHTQEQNINVSQSIE